MAHRRRILILQSEKLLPASLLSLLAAQPELDVTNTTLGSIESLDQGDNLAPDVVILEEELLAANLSAVVKLADKHPKLRLIVPLLGENQLHVFDKQMVQVKQFEDFLELL